MPITPAANLSLLWSELPYLDRFDAAAEAGFGAVEVLFPYDMPAKETQRALLRNGLNLALINAPPPNYTGGQPGFAAIPGGEARFAHDMRRVWRYVDALRPKMVHVMAGEAKGAAATETFVANLRNAAAEAPPGVTLMIVEFDSAESAAENDEKAGTQEAAAENSDGTTFRNLDVHGVVEI